MGSRMVNARAETVADRPTFRTALRRRRYLVLADGFYEWQNSGSSGRFQRAALAGRHAVRRDVRPCRTMVDVEGAETLFAPCCTITTAEANDPLSPKHYRMPLILSRDDDDFWLDVSDPVALAEVLKQYPADAMEAYVVSSQVILYTNDSPEVIWPMARTG